MSRAKSSRFRSRKVGEQELLQSFDQSLTTLVHLSKVYDGGYPPISLLMATEVYKILTENGPAMKLRRSRTFATVIYPDEALMLNSLHKLVLAQTFSAAPYLSFVPLFFVEGYPAQIQHLDFSAWWNKDIIYRASAAVPGTPAGHIPVNDSPTVNFEDREKINRRDFVSLLRNKLGAHQEADMPELLDELVQSRSWGGFVVETPDGVFSTDDGTLIPQTNIMAAMMRQITHEVLQAYERDDPSPLPDNQN